METMANLLAKMNLPGKAPTLDQLISHQGIRNFLNANPHITRSTLEKSKSRLNEFVMAQNRITEIGMEPVLFLYMDYIDVRYQPTDRLLALREEKRKAGLVVNHTISQAAREATFDKVHMTRDRLPLIKFVRDFATKYIANNQGIHKGAYVSGSYGVGKTYILSALANYLAKHNQSVRIEHFPTFLNHLKSKIASNEVMPELKKLQTVPVLILDDFGSEKMTEWLRDDIILNLFEYRMNNYLVTFISSNLTMFELRDYLATTREGVDYRKADRILERIKFLTSEIELTGTNKRNPEVSDD